MVPLRFSIAPLGIVGIAALLLFAWTSQARQGIARDGVEYSRDGSSNVAPSGRVLLQATAASSGTTMGVVSIDPGSSTVTFSTFMEFVPSTDQDDNSTQVLTQRYKQAIAQALGTPAADIIITNQATVYYRLISQSGERQTYLGDAEMETLLVYPTEAAATAAFDTINADSALWADETFTADLFPALTYVEVLEPALNLPAAPQPPQPPAYPAGKVPLVFTTTMTYSGDGPGFTAIRSPRDAYVTVLSREMGVELRDVVIRYLETTWSESGSTATISRQTLDTAVLFDLEADADSWATEIQSPSWPGEAFTLAAFPSLTGATISSVSVLQANAGSPSSPPPPHSSAQGEFAVRFNLWIQLCICSDNIATSETTLSTNYRSFISQSLGVPLEDVIIPGYDVVYVNYSNTVENSSSAEKRRVVSDCDFETRLITSSASEAESWAATVQSEQWIYQTFSGLIPGFVAATERSARVIYPPGYVAPPPPPPPSYPNNTFPFSFTVNLTVTTNPNATTIEEQVATVANRYIQVVSDAIGAGSSTLLVSDLIVHELSWNPTSATYIIEIRSIVVLPSPALQIEWSAAVISSEWIQTVFTPALFPGLIGARSGDVVLLPTYGNPPPPTSSPPPPSPSSSPPPYTAAPPPPTYPPCVFPLRFGTLFSFGQVSGTELLDTDARVEQYTEAYMRLMNEEFGQGSVYLIDVQRTEVISEVQSNVNYTSNAALTLARLEFKTAVTSEALEGAQAKESMISDPSWATTVFAKEDFQYLDRVRVSFKELLPQNEDGYGPGHCSPPVPTSSPYVEDVGGPCKDVYVVAWNVKVFPHDKTASEETESSENLGWPPDLEHRWDTVTLPGIRATAAWRMGVAADSNMIQHKPACDVDHRLEDIHADFDCRENGVKRVAKFRSYFYDYQQAIAFKDWVFFEDGYYFAAILLRDNRWICGANIKQDRRLYIDYDCQIDDYCPNGNYSSPQHTPYPPSPPPASYPAPPPPHYKSSDDSEAQSSSHKARHASQRLEEPSAKTLRYPSYEFNSEGQGAEDRGPKDYSPAVSFFPMLLESIGIVETAASQAKERQPGQQKPFCSQYYTVRWELTLLPAVGSTASTRAFGPLGWPPSADGHFYRITDPLIRQLAGEYIGLEQDSERIQLVEIEHSVGGLSGSSCPGGIVKHARYEFLFGSELEARRLQEWLDRGDSSGLVASLRTRDSAGMCSGRGATEPIRREARC